MNSTTSSPPTSRTSRFSTGVPLSAPTATSLIIAVHASQDTPFKMANASQTLTGPITASKADSSKTTSARSIATGNVEAATWRGQTASSVLTSTSRTAVENALSKIKLYLYWGGFDRCWISSKGEELKRCFLLLTICGCTTTTATNTMGLPSRYSRPSSL